MVDKGKLSATEAKETAEKIAEDGKREFESATTQLQEKFDELLSKAGFNQSKRIDEMETKVADLEARLKSLEDSGSERRYRHPATPAIIASRLLIGQRCGIVI